MPRYGPPPSADAPPPEPPDERSGVTRWSWRAKTLSVIAGFGMVAAFVFEFLPPTRTSPSGSDKTSTTVAVTSTAPTPSTTEPPSTTATPGP